MATINQIFLNFDHEELNETAKAQVSGSGLPAWGDNNWPHTFGAINKRLPAIKGELETKAATVAQAVGAVMVAVQADAASGKVIVPSADGGWMRVEGATYDQLAMALFGINGDGLRAYHAAYQTGDVLNLEVDYAFTALNIPPLASTADYRADAPLAITENDWETWVSDIQDNIGKNSANAAAALLTALTKWRGTIYEQVEVSLGAGGGTTLCGKSASRADYTDTVHCAFTLDAKGMIDLEKLGQGFLSEWGKRSGDITTALRNGEIENAENIALAGIEKDEKDRDEGAKKILEALYFDQILYKEQCFLLAQIFNFVSYRAQMETTEGNEKRLPYNGGTPGKNGVNSSLMLHGDPYGLLNKLTQHPSQSRFFDIATSELSSLQPRINLFKIIQDANGNEQQVPIRFASYAEADDVLSVFEHTDKRGFGVGLKDFTFSYEGDTPFAVKKAIKARLTLFANSFEELLKEQTITLDTGTTHTFRYVDLALKTGTNPHKKIHTDKTKAEIARLEENLDKLNFRLKAVVGWAQPNGASPATTDILSAINDSYITLNLTPTVHDFQIDDQGRVTFEIDYYAYVEDGLNQAAFNIFFDEEVAIQTLLRRLQHRYLSGTCNHSQMEEWRRLEKEAIENNKRKALMSIFKGLRKANKIRFINMSREQLMDFTTQGPFYEPAQEIEITTWADQGKATQQAITQLLQVTQAGLQEGDTKSALNPTSVIQNLKDENLSFFFAGDLIDLILEGIDNSLSVQQQVLAKGIMATMDIHSAIDDIETASKETLEIWKLTGKLTEGMREGFVTVDDLKEELFKIRAYKKQFEKLRILLGPLELVDPRNGMASNFINFGDIPISTRYFMEWLSVKTTAQDRVLFPLPAFLNQFFNELLKTFLNQDGCFSVSTKQKTRITQTALTSYKNNNADRITELLKQQRTQSSNPALSRLLLAKTAEQPILSVSGPPDMRPETGIENEINYYLFFAARTQPAERMNGDREEDEKAGIFHYMIGKDSGIIKTIRLTRANTPGYKEMRYEQQGYDGLEQLREVYNVDITCYANVQAFPGTYIYVDPRGFSPNTATADDPAFDLTRYGIGGYCMIYRSEHSFGEGKAETTIQARWVAQIDSETDDAEDYEADASNTKEAARQPGRGADSLNLCKQLRTNRNEKTQSWVSKAWDSWSDFITTDNIADNPDDVRENLQGGRN